MSVPATENRIENAYKPAKESYAAVGVDTEAAMERVVATPISIHCWQGDDVGGFETDDGLTGGGIQATGNYPGKARNADELRTDFQKACSLIPGTHRMNLHAIYAETGGKRVDRNELEPEHFSRWIDWAAETGLHGLDFNPSFFSHPNAADGFTLTHPDPTIRRFWIEHGAVCRTIGEHMGRRLGTPCVTNVWIPDGYKDTPADRLAPRERLREALDEVFDKKLDPRFLLDSVESKLFGIGSESYVAGSHEFYMGYAIRNNKLLCLDAGHFHPTETISDKISAVLLFLDELLLHVSRGVRWDSDHVVTFSDELRAIAQELVWNDFLGRVHIGLDFFDASINRVAAWVIGTRAMCQALLAAALTPCDTLRALEGDNDFTGRLALLEQAKLMPLGAVWDYYCLKHDVPVGATWLDEVRAYEKTVLEARGS